MAKSTFARELERALIKAVIGLGAGLLIWFVGMQVITHTFSNMQEEMLVNTHAAQERANAKLRELQARQEAERQQRQVRQTMSEEEARRQSAVEQQRANEAWAAQIERQREKDAAWQDFYKEPRGCSNWQTDQQMVECQNQKLRAKREFERKWKAGEIAGKG
ncbi:hypothetical protein SAMN05216577_104128 [Pseudomonas citronellolis]|uniref:Uncharacterized protein n=1 Tax=Pseudomonas citronellolis TaxID=53408 RepID=A0AAQ1HK43_9PSED|nr:MULTISPECIES: hypothetical protein [Pseudomonas]MBB1608066.1 hypothetical protein [Pseudomonas sp. UMC76]MBB1637119.1 hypothetical protein [Pseudomonas sp. UME83]MCP1606166.1 tryptophan 2,3-dioxygenase [Pseudomonas citronellolis]MCP1641539.1 tryptophan 2,3-dioxygenase [Pseudomonas citronellolis]MCP1656872.1 tryptophan 2,3-dioxygenase [Pseudomonas citronellolis]